MDSHDVLGVPVHDCILEVETLEKCDGSRFYLLGKFEGGTQLGDLGDIESDEEKLLVWIEKEGGIRRARLEQMSPAGVGEAGTDLVSVEAEFDCFGGGGIEETSGVGELGGGKPPVSKVSARIVERRLSWDRLLGVHLSVVE